jgi:ATP-dependent RNA helicase SUPV3L1/SUV3
VPAKERAVRRLEAFLAAEASLRLAPLKALEAATTSGALKGLARGIAYRLVECGGVLDRGLVEAELAALSQAERRTLRTLGVRFGAFSLFLPDLLNPDALGFSRAFAHCALPDWPARSDGISDLANIAPPPQVLAALGLRAVGRLAVPVLDLEQLDSLMRSQPAVNGAMSLTTGALGVLGWGLDQASSLLRGLGFSPVGKITADAPSLWRRRRAGAQRPVLGQEVAAPSNSPFAALAALKAASPVPQRPRRRRSKHKRSAGSGAG